MRKSGKMSQKLLLLLGSLILVASAQQPSSNFTGTIQRLTETPPGQITYIHFDAGARTKWHTHEKGQLVFVEEGVGLAQERGGPIVEIHAGEAIWCPPGVEHWHGAAPDKGGTQYNITRGSIKWGAEVTDQEFTAKTVRKK
jgi:4-carboxymuconolactone decarboxylase